jgi:hypothetical protein
MLKGEIDAALVAHIKWLVIFKNHLTGIERDELEPTVVQDGVACSFGKWLHANKALLPFPEQFEYIQALHAIFHIAAAEMVVAVQTHQDIDEIKRRLRELQRLSNQLIAALSEVKASLFPIRQRATTLPVTRQRSAGAL